MADSPASGLPKETRRYDVLVTVVYIDEHGVPHEDEVISMDEITEAAKDLLVKRLNVEFGNFIQYMAEQQRWDFYPGFLTDTFHQPGLFGYNVDIWGDFELML